MNDGKRCDMRFNLYYIFKEDKENHPLLREKAENIRRMLFAQSDGDP